MIGSTRDNSAENSTPELRKQAELAAPAFTPGPWKVDRFPGVIVGGPMVAYERGEGQCQLAAVGLSETVDEATREANAALIAAAPDLYEALTALLAGCIEEYGEPDEGAPDEGAADEGAADEGAADESVGWNGDGSMMAFTFGLMQRARAALSKAAGSEPLEGKE